MRYALIKSGVVENIIVAEDWPDGIALANDADVGIGDVFDGQTFSKPISLEPVLGSPVAVSMRQARLALLGAGILGAVNDAISGMNGVAGEAARIEWEYATEVRRDSALVSGMTATLGLTAAQLDALFTQASTL